MAGEKGFRSFALVIGSLLGVNDDALKRSSTPKLARPPAEVPERTKETA
jgi:hypothetical protein